MTQRIYQFSLLLLCYMFLFNATCYAAMDTGVPTPGASIQWQGWSNKAFAEAKAKKLRVLVYVKADWCRFCQLMNAVTFRDAEVIQVINAGYVPVRLDVEKDADVLQQYQITGFPTVVIFNANKQIIKQFTGFTSPGEVVKILTF